MVIQSGRKIKETSLRHLEIESTVRWKMFLKMLGMHMSFLLPAAVGQLAFVIGWFLLIFYTKDLVKVNYSWLHWCACRSRVFPYYWLIWSMPWKHEWNPTRTLPNTHAACCQLRFQASRELWLGWFRFDSGSKRQPYQRFGTGHRFGGVPITTNCLYIGLMIPIIWAIYSQSHKKQYIFLVWTPPLWDPCDPDRIRVRVPRVLANPKGIIGFNWWLRYLLLLGGEIDRNPSPRRRGPMDFTVGFVKATSDRMSRCLEGFKRWCEEVAEISWATLEAEPQAVAWPLRGYGLYLVFEQGHARFFTPMPSQLLKSVCRVAVLSLALPGRSTKSGRFMSLEIAGQFSHSTTIWAPMHRGGIAWQSSFSLACGQNWEWWHNKQIPLFWSRWVRNTYPVECSLGKPPRQPPLCWLGIVLASGLFEILVGVCLLTVCFWPGDCTGWDGILFPRGAAIYREFTLLDELGEVRAISYTGQPSKTS